mmetsp:Transcript_25503/g.39776  ORF Transcript_25503/g.39776 Transcript_25503/m.39776 type:complete len:170 (-) Transcript_25503:49-558(-)
MWLIVTLVYSEVILDESGGSSACEGRVVSSYDEEEEDTRKLALAYQSVIIAITFLLTSVFFYYTYQVYNNTKKKASSVKQFVIVVGGIFNLCFLVRTVLFLIILAVDFASSVYLFCTIFFTEVVMMIILLIQFNIRYFKLLASAVSDQTGKTSSSRSGSMTPRASGSHA